MSAFEVTGSRITWRGDGETLVVEPWGRDSVRVRAVMMGEIRDTDWALLPPAESDAEVEATGDDTGASAVLVNGRIRVVLRHSTVEAESLQHVVHRCALSFHDADDRLLLRELDTGGSLNLRPRRWEPKSGGGHRLTASFESDPDEMLFGMGQYQQDVLDLKGSTLELAHRNSQVSVPVLVSSAGYGFFWHNPAIGRATLGRNRTEWVAEATDQLDYWVTAAGPPAAVCAAYADATGHVPMMPERGLGFWQCKLRYWNQDQLLAVVREHRRRGLPMDVVVADFFHWPHLGDYRFEDEFWPDPAAMIAELAEHDVELMVSVWPQVSPDSENYAGLAKDNLLVRAEGGLQPQMSFQGPSMFMDVTNPEARDALWRMCRDNYHRHGIRTFWLDEAEPEYGSYDYEHFRYHVGPVLSVGNVYPQLFARAFHEGLREEGESEIVNLIRCAWAGSQRYGALVWSGDIHSTFTDLRRQLVAGIHMGLAGIPWFTTDIGGFHHGDIADPAFHELLVRWFQFGTFCPVMRLHGDRRPFEDVTATDGTARFRSGAGNELWSFGDEVFALLEPLVHLREAMRPYVRRVMAEAHTGGQPVMRALFHEFPGDARCWRIDDQFLFGPSILVAPVMTAGATSRSVYLPPGATWTRLTDGATHDGGQWLEVGAPLAGVPVFLRDGALEELIGALGASSSRPEGDAAPAVG